MSIKTMHKVLLGAITIPAMLILFTLPGYPCFDTFLVLHKKSMVYPRGYAALDVFAEHSFGDAQNAGEDSSVVNYNLYYGLAERFSVQFGVSSAETARGEGGNDAGSWSARGVMNALKLGDGAYYMDLILEHHTGVDAEGNTTVFSMPNIFNINNFVLVVHPVYEMNRTQGDNGYALGGHAGLFYNVNNRGVIGVGAEYAGPQSGSALNRSLTGGEAAASLFMGFNLGNVYFQNEFAKGLSGSRDYGIAATVKLFMDMGVHL